MAQLPVNPEPEGGQLCLYPAAFYGEERQPVEQKEGGASIVRTVHSPIPAIPGYPLLVSLQGAADFPASLLSTHAGPAPTFGPLLSGSPDEGLTSCLPSLSLLTISFFIFKMGRRVLPLNP